MTTIHAPQTIPQSPQDLQDYIDRQGITATLIGGLGDTPTVPAAAAALGVESEQIIKTLLFLVEPQGAPEQPVVVISYGEQRVDRGQLAVRWGVGKKRVSLAPAPVVLELLGYAAGGVPPFGHRTALPVLIDAGILNLRTRYGGIIYGGGGDDRTMMKLTVDELLRVTGGEVIGLNLDA
jgi:prolyl-tRNA editing enzyme YbaK/EbsC (Cys-tRNA(Pro) deacylase)